MKLNFGTMILLLTIMLAMSNCSFSQELREIRPTKNPIVIDGVRENAWKQSRLALYPAPEYNSGSIDNRPESRGLEIETLYNEASLYFLIKVKDDVLVGDKTDYMRNDSIVVLITASTFDKAKAYIFSRDKTPKLLNLASGVVSEASIQSACQTEPTGLGWNLEFALNRTSTIGANTKIVKTAVMQFDNDNNPDEWGYKLLTTTSDGILAMTRTAGWSNVSLVGAVPATLPEVSVADLLGLPEDLTVTVYANMSITASSGSDYFYIQDNLNRLFRLKVISSQEFKAGQRLYCMTGKMSKVNSEKVFIAETIEASSKEENDLLPEMMPDPFYANVKNIGTGASNIGIRIKTAGKVKTVLSDGFVLENTGIIKIKASTVVSEGENVTVTGVPINDESSITILANTVEEVTP